jgi:hypothetical protein
MRFNTKDRDKTFLTTEDFDNEIALSKDMYNSQGMFGIMKYVYHPNIGVYNFTLWTGLHWKRFAIAAASSPIDYH